MIKTILCIEDDRFIGEMYIRSLKKAGYEVTWLTDGSQAYVTAKENAFDLILLDIMLPETRGTDILRMLRQENTLPPTTKILVLTNYDQDDESRAVMEQQADGYLIKAEITPRKLLEIITQLDAAASQAQPEPATPPSQ